MAAPALCPGRCAEETLQQAAPHPACRHGGPCLRLAQSGHEERKKKRAMRGRENKGQGKVIKSREKEHIDRKSNEQKRKRGLSWEGGEIRAVEENRVG